MKKKKKKTRLVKGGFLLTSGDSEGAGCITGGGSGLSRLINNPFNGRGIFCNVSSQEEKGTSTISLGRREGNFDRNKHTRHACTASSLDCGDPLGGEERQRAAGAVGCPKRGEPNFKTRENAHDCPGKNTRRQALKKQVWDFGFMSPARTSKGERGKKDPETPNERIKRERGKTIL